MRNPFHLLAALLLFANMSPAIAAENLAAEAANTAALAPHDDLYSAIFESVDQGTTLNKLLDTIMAALEREVPEIALIEDAKPGFLADLRTQMLPIMTGYSARVQTKYRPKVVKALSEEMTADEARQAAAFYRSDLGRKLMAGAVQNFNLDETVRSAVKNPDAPVEGSAVTADFKRIGVQAYLSLTPEERKQLDLAASQNPALLKMAAAQPRIRALRVEMENEPPTPEESARLEAVLQAAFTKLDD